MTLDTNCLIDLEQASPNTKHIKDLVQRYERGEIELRLPAISASERQPGGGFLDSFADFQKRVEAAGLGGVRLIQPILYWGVTFSGFSLWANESMKRLEERIHAVLYPSIEFQYADYCESAP